MCGDFIFRQIKEKLIISMLWAILRGDADNYLVVICGYLSAKIAFFE